MKNKSYKNKIRFKIKTLNSKKAPVKKVWRNYISLTQNNRITYVYHKKTTGKVTRLVCISLEMLYEEKWVTIMRYDDFHGYLHKHEIINLDGKSDTPTVLGVRQKGTNHRLLTWALKDIRNNYLIYKTRFLKRSGFNKDEITEQLI